MNTDILTAVKRPVAPRPPDPAWNDAQRRAHEAAIAACDAWLAIGELHQRQVPLGELELAAYELWQRVEAEIAPLFAETDEEETEEGD